jgi:hypothetical protein
VPSPDFPHDLFTQADRDRSSQYPVILEADITRKDNYATKLAALALQIAPNNKKRHETLQRFMLLNDSARIAVEVGCLGATEHKTGLRKVLDPKVLNHVPLEPQHLPASARALTALVRCKATGRCERKC